MTTVANVACPVDGSELEGERMMSLCARHIGYGTDLAPPQERWTLPVLRQRLEASRLATPAVG
jgi:hypothetical protein